MRVKIINHKTRRLSDVSYVVANERTIDHKVCEYNIIVGREDGKNITSWYNPEDIILVEEETNDKALQASDIVRMLEKKELLYGEPIINKLGNVVIIENANANIQYLIQSAPFTIGSFHTFDEARLLALKDPNHCAYFKHAKMDKYTNMYGVLKWLDGYNEESINEHLSSKAWLVQHEQDAKNIKVK